jgi:hypothetical protein
MCSKDTCPSRQINAAGDAIERRSVPRISKSICSYTPMYTVHERVSAWSIKKGAGRAAGSRPTAPGDGCKTTVACRFSAGGHQLSVAQNGARGTTLQTTRAAAVVEACGDSR